MAAAREQRGAARSSQGQPGNTQEPPEIARGSREQLGSSQGAAWSRQDELVTARST